MGFHREQPYNDLPALPPRADLETPTILKAVIRASRALADLKGRTHTIPNPDILLNTIALQEARLSSEIENIFTTDDELFRGLGLEELGLSPHTKEVLHYREALWRGALILRERPVLGTNLFEQLNGLVKESAAGVRKTSGTRIGNPSTGETIYTPPEGEDTIRAMLHNLEIYCNEPSDAVDPLVQMAVMHYQFEAIHPFHDGNGRTGRILLILFLLLHGLLELPILFLSRYIIRNKATYYRLLREVTEQQAWEPWVLYMLDAVESTARYTSQKIAALHDLLAATIAQARERLPKRTFSKELIELIFEQPYCRIRLVERAGIAQRLTASKYLRDLEAAGFLRAQKLGTELVFINESLVALLAKD